MHSYPEMNDAPSVRDAIMVVNFALCTNMASVIIFPGSTSCIYWVPSAWGWAGRGCWKVACRNGWHDKDAGLYLLWIPALHWVGAAFLAREREPKWTWNQNGLPPGILQASLGVTMIKSISGGCKYLLINAMIGWFGCHYGCLSWGERKACFHLVVFNAWHSTGTPLLRDRTQCKSRVTHSQGFVFNISSDYISFA